MPSVTAVIITQDEEKRIGRCLDALEWVHEIVIVDSGSHDKTVSVAKNYTQKIFHRDFDDYASQKNFGIDQAAGEWILSVDADEIVSPELKDAISEVTRNGSAEDGYRFRLVNYIFGRRMEKGDSDKSMILRFFRKAKGKYVQPIHERVVVDGPVGELRGELLHYGTTSIDEYMKKLNCYTDREAGWLYEKGVRPKLTDMTFKPAARFIYFYFIKMGFLDGYAGFLYHSLSSFYLFLKYAKLREYYEKAKKA